MKRNTSHTDEELIRLLLAGGGTHHYEVLYNRYFRKVYYQVISYVKEEEEAQDIAQDIFVKLYDRLSKFEGKSSFSTWLFSFARNTVLDYLRKKGRMKEDKLPERELESIPEVGDDELLRMRADRLASIMEQISPDEKAILVMMYAHDWQMDEIADFMGLGLSATKMRLKRAKLKVKELYEAEYPE